MNKNTRIKAYAASLLLLVSSSAQAHSADNLTLSAHWQAHLILAGVGLGALFLLWLGIRRKTGRAA